MIVLSSKRPHDQGVKHRMANDCRNDAPALPAAQTVDNASNDRQFQIDSAASVGNRKYECHAEHDENLKRSFPSQVSSYKEKSVIHQAAKEQLLCYRRDEYRPQHFSRRHLSIDRQTPAGHAYPEQCEEADRRERRRLNCAAVYRLQRQCWSPVRTAHLPSEFPKPNREQAYHPPIGNSRTHHSQAPRRQPCNRKPLPPPFHPGRLRHDYF
jgi:hypothetical protein